MVGFPQFTRSHYFGLKTIFAVEAFHGRLLDWEPQGNIAHLLIRISQLRWKSNKTQETPEKLTEIQLKMKPQRSLKR